jgi:hypothetical protein
MLLLTHTCVYHSGDQFPISGFAASIQTICLNASEGSNLFYRKNAVMVILFVYLLRGWVVRPIIFQISNYLNDDLLLKVNKVARSR